MPSTTDTYTGKRFRYTESTRYLGLIVPCRYTTARCIVLAPDRVPLPLLRELNPDRVLINSAAVVAIQREHLTPAEH